MIHIILQLEFLTEVIPKLQEMKKWDDGNYLNGDGCSSNWLTIEDNWIWVNGNSTHKSDWSPWVAGYTPNSDHSACTISEIKPEIKEHLIIIASIVGTSIAVNIAFVAINWASVQSTFSFLNQIQLFLLIPLTGGYFPTEILQFISGMVSYINLKSILNPFEFTDFNFISKVDYIKDLLRYDQSDNYLSLLTFKDQSTFNNIIGYLNVLILFLIIQISWFLLFKIFDKIKWGRAISNTCDAIYESFTFGWYIRLLIEVYIYILISWVSELYVFRFERSHHIASKAISGLVFILWNVVIIWCFIMILTTNISSNSQNQKRKLCGHMFSGLKVQRKSKFYILLYFIRRELFWILTLLFKDLKMAFKISLFSAIQFSYLTCLWFIRPFKNTKDNTVVLIV